MREEAMLELLKMGVACVEQNGSLRLETRNESGMYVCEHEDAVELHGNFTANQLRAMAEWMENNK